MPANKIHQLEELARIVGEIAITYQRLSKLGAATSTHTSEYEESKALRKSLSSLISANVPGTAISDMFGRLNEIKTRFDQDLPLAQKQEEEKSHKEVQQPVHWDNIKGRARASASPPVSNEAKARAEEREAKAQASQQPSVRDKLASLFLSRKSGGSPPSPKPRNPNDAAPNPGNDQGRKRSKP
jgi:hypothetical protein